MVPPNITSIANAVSVAPIPICLGYAFVASLLSGFLRTGGRLKSSQMNAYQIMHTGQSEVDPIVSAIRSGDSWAFDLIFEQFYNVLQNFIGHYIKDNSLAQDLVSDTFEKFWKERERIQGPGLPQIKHYLLKIARNLCFDVYRRRQLKSRFVSDYLNSQESAESGMQQIDIWSAVIEELNRLPAAYAQILTLYYVDTLSYPEISVRLGITEVAARRRKFRAINVLRQRFEDFGAVKAV